MPEDLLYQINMLPTQSVRTQRHASQQQQQQHGLTESSTTSFTACYIHQVLAQPEVSKLADRESTQLWSPSSIFSTGNSVLLIVLQKLAEINHRYFAPIMRSKLQRWELDRHMREFRLIGSIVDSRWTYETLNFKELLSRRTTHFRERIRVVFHQLLI